MSAQANASPLHWPSGQPRTPAARSSVGRALGRWFESSRALHFCLRGD